MADNFKIEANQSKFVSRMFKTYIKLKFMGYLVSRLIFIFQSFSIKNPKWIFCYLYFFNCHSLEILFSYNRNSNIRNFCSKIAKNSSPEKYFKRRLSFSFVYYYSLRPFFTCYIKHYITHISNFNQQIVFTINLSKLRTFDGIIVLNERWSKIRYVQSLYKNLSYGKDDYDDDDDDNNNNENEDENKSVEKIWIIFSLSLHDSPLAYVNYFLR